jgi:DeoR/GlpR family transcriptional regulator of sugar metabolism
LQHNPIVGVATLSPDGFSVDNLEEALVTKEMMRLSRRTILVADASKFGRTALALVAHLRAAQILVTDAVPSGSLAKALVDVELQVLVCP